jgi:hypothetical protein
MREFRRFAQAEISLKPAACASKKLLRSWEKFAVAKRGFIRLQTKEPDNESKLSLQFRFVFGVFRRVNRSEGRRPGVNGCGED